MAYLGIVLALLSIFFPLVFIPVFIALRKRRANIRNLVYVLQTCLHLVIVFAFVWYSLPGVPFDFNFFFMQFQVDIWLLAIVAAIALSNFFILLYNYGHGYSSSVYYDIFLCILLSGLMGAGLSSGVITSYIFLDIVLFSAGYLIYSIKGAIKAAYKYTFMNLFASLLIHFSIILYLSPEYQNGLMATGFLVGFLIKAGAIPFHFWVPTVYSKAPIPVTALLAGGANAIVLLTIFKFMPILNIGPALQVIGLLTAFAGGLLSMGQVYIRKTFGYFSIAETGFIIYAFGLGSHAAIIGAFILLLTQIFSKALLFQFAGLVTEKDSVLTRHYNLALFSLLAGGFSVVGIPLTGGFAGKFAILSAAYSVGGYVPIAILLASGFFMLFSLLRVYGHLSTIRGRIRPHYTILRSIFFIAVIIIIAGIVPFLGGFI